MLEFLQGSLDIEIDRPVPGSETAYIDEIEENIFLCFDADDRPFAVDARQETSIDEIDEAIALYFPDLDKRVDTGSAIDTEGGFRIYRLVDRAIASHQ